MVSKQKEKFEQLADEFVTEPNGIARERLKKSLPV